MKENLQLWHSDTMAAHEALMFQTLIYPHNIISEGVKVYQFEDKDGSPLNETFRGYMAVKEVDGHKRKYFLDEDAYHELPIRINDSRELFFKDSGKSRSVILQVTLYKAFKVIPEAGWSDQSLFLQEFAPFEHSRPDNWELLKIMAIMGYAGKTFLCICGPSELGKSSIFRAIHGLTSKSIVFRPRSAAGMLLQMNEDGNMVFDEIHKTTKETLDITEEVAQMVGDGSPNYINGAIKAKYLKQIYRTSDQSLTFLFNLYSYYKKPEEEFFENIWKNPVALGTKFLKVKLEGELTEKFDKLFDVMQVAEANRMTYMKFAKHLMWIKAVKKNNTYKRRFAAQGLDLKGRHTILYDEICWGIDFFSRDQTQYSDRVAVFNKSINDYREMLGRKQYDVQNPMVFNQESPQTTLVGKEESVE